MSLFTPNPELPTPAATGVTDTRTAHDDGHPVLDDPRQWSSEIEPPAGFDVAAYQVLVDSICGRNAAGQSVMVVRWMPQCRTHLHNGRPMPRYWVARKRNGDDWTYFCPPRWVFEQRHERATYYSAWEATRWALEDPDGDPSQCLSCGSIDCAVQLGPEVRCRNCYSANVRGGAKVDKGPPPEEYFSYAYLAAEHEQSFTEEGWPTCCDRLYREGRRRCWGRFRNPNDSDLEVLRAAVRAREAERFRDPYRPLTREDLYELELAAAVQVERQDAELRERKMDELNQLWKEDGWRVTETDEGVLTHGRHCHYVNYHRTEAGVWIPQSSVSSEPLPAGAPGE